MKQETCTRHVMSHEKMERGDRGRDGGGEGRLPEGAWAGKGVRCVLPHPGSNVCVQNKTKTAKT